MTDLFLDVLNASYAASFVVLAVILARMVLKKAPRWMICALWALVAVRLLAPVIPEAAFSLMPSSQIIPPQSLYDTAPQIHSGIITLDRAINPVYSESLRPTPGASVNPLQVWLAVFANLWVLGMGAMTLWAGISCLRVRRQVRESIPEEGIFLCDRINSPFIFGLLCPKIYLPSDLDEASRAHVIAHERAHLSRRDHWWKPLGFALLTVNWFNPLLWAAYVLLCRDIEMACDEKVIRDLTAPEKKAYSAALLRCSVNPQRITACPLAFGEVGVKQRIKSVLHYKKPAFWIILLTVALTIVLAVGLLTDPESPAPQIRWDGTLYIQDGKVQKELPQNALEVGTLVGIAPENSSPMQNGFGTNLSECYVNLRLYLAEGTLYLTEIGSDSWLPFVPMHTPEDVIDLLSGDVQCQLNIMGDEVTLTEFLSRDDESELEKILSGCLMVPSMDFDFRMLANNYAENTCILLDKTDFTRHCLLLRRENDWLAVYRDEDWAASAWTFQSPELDASLHAWQNELSASTAIFSPIAGENAICLETHTFTLDTLTLRCAIPSHPLGDLTTAIQWEYQAHTAYIDKTITIECRPSGRTDWMQIHYRDQREPLATYGFQKNDLQLENGATGTLYHANDPDRWSEAILDTTRGQLYVTAPNASLQQTDWTHEDYRMALAILGTLQLTENGDTLFGVPADEETADLGISLHVENVTHNGALLVCTQDGTHWDEIITGAPWNLERYEEGSWIPVMPESTVWTSIAYPVEPGSTKSWNINWSLIVGSIGPGRYRVSKSFTGIRNPVFTLGQEKQEVRQICYAEFTIEDPLPVQFNFSQQMHQAILADWEAYASMSIEQQFSSSKMPGSCIQEFDDWAQVEQFVGMPIPNPLEDLESLEKGNWAAAPEGFNGGARFCISWYGNREGQIEQVSVDSGYRRDRIRICVKAEFCSDTAQFEPVITADAGLQYEARTAQLSRGPILYSIRIIGEVGTGDQLMALLTEILPYFEELPSS